jgi:hypothetical protein
MSQPLGASILDVVTAKALGDPAYKEALLAKPNEVLTSEGLKIPDGVAVKILENTADTVYLVLPTEAPTDAVLPSADITLFPWWWGGPV